MGADSDRRRGFALIEIAIVTAIIGLLAVIAVPFARRARRRTEDVLFVRELRELSHAFEQYALEQGDYPSDAQPGVLPPGMQPYLPRRPEWDAGPSVGGQWEWDRAENRETTLHGGYAGLSVYRPFRTRAQMREIDRLLDDGDLATGLFRSRPEGYIYFLEE